MGFKVHYANPDERMSQPFLGRDYEVLNPIKFITETFTMDKYPTDHHEFTSGILVGSMAGGKSNLIRYFAAIAKEIFKKRLNAMYVRDIAAGIEACIKFPSYVQFLAIDDAVTKGMDSRRSMSSENVSLSEKYFLIRHELEEAYTAGYEIILLGTQDYNAIDSRIRKNAHFTIFKSYYPEIEQFLQYDLEMIEFLKEVTDEGGRKHNYPARGFGVGFTQVGDLVKLYVPEVKPEDVPFIKTVSIDSKKERIKNQLIQEIIEKNVLSGGGGVAAGHGFIINRLTQLDSSRYITFSPSDRTVIIHLAKYFSTSGDSQLFKEKIELKQKIREELIQSDLAQESMNFLKSHIRKMLKSKGKTEKYLNDRELSHMVEDIKYEYSLSIRPKDQEQNKIDENKVIDTTTTQLLTQLLKNPTVKNRIIVSLKMKETGTIADITKGILREGETYDKLYPQVKAALHKEDDFMHVDRGIYALNGSRNPEPDTVKNDNKEVV